MRVSAEKTLPISAIRFPTSGLRAISRISTRTRSGSASQEPRKIEAKRRSCSASASSDRSMRSVSRTSSSQLERKIVSSTSSLERK